MVAFKIYTVILLGAFIGSTSSSGSLMDHHLWEYVPQAIRDNPVAMARLEKEFVNSDFFKDDSSAQSRNSFLDWLYGLLGITTSTTTQAPQPPESCSPCKCGKPNTRIRIVGGQETEVNEYPWMTLLLYDGRFYCGGSLLNDRYVLTAAHCTRGFNPTRMSVRFLEHNRATTGETQTITRQVERVLIHPKYSTLNYNNDLALLKLNETVEFSGLLRPVCMPTGGKSFTGYEGIATGWGATMESGSTSDTLQEVVVPIISNADCKESYGQSRITDNMLCAGYKEGGKDSCQGDSGGPLHVKNATTTIHQIVGITSWGEGCAQEDKPGVYTRVNRYITWLKSNTQDACYCNSS